MRKAEFLTHWQAIAPNQPVRPSPVPYKHEGSTYEEDGIRVTGSRAFVDSVLSRLKDLIDFEAADTRLQVVHQPVKDKKTGLPSYRDAVSCYVQVHRRGPEAQIMNARFKRPTAKAKQRTRAKHDAADDDLLAKFGIDLDTGSFAHA